MRTLTPVPLGMLAFHLQPNKLPFPLHHSPESVAEMLLRFLLFLCVLNLFGKPERKSYNQIRVKPWDLIWKVAFSSWDDGEVVSTATSEQESLGFGFAGWVLSVFLYVCWIWDRHECGCVICPTLFENHSGLQHPAISSPSELQYWVEVVYCIMMKYY